MIHVVKKDIIQLEKIVKVLGVPIVGLFKKNMTDRMTKKAKKFLHVQHKNQQHHSRNNPKKHLWKKGLKGYRINPKITGKPDIYFPKKKIAIFTDGYFWHKCPKCFIPPKSNKRYWRRKIENNKKRDMVVNKKLRKRKIDVIKIREHDIINNIDKPLKFIKECYEKK